MFDQPSAGRLVDSPKPRRSTRTTSSSSTRRGSRPVPHCGDRPRLRGSGRPGGRWSSRRSWARSSSLVIALDPTVTGLAEQANMERMPDFLEVADRVWVARYDWFDVNVTLIGSDRGLVVVDTHGSTKMGHEVIGDVRRLGQVTCRSSSTRTGTSTTPSATRRSGRCTARSRSTPTERRHRAGRGRGEPQAALPRQRRPAPRRGDGVRDRAARPHVLLVHVLDLGDRQVELLYPGRGHTSGDIVVRVPEVEWSSPATWSRSRRRRRSGWTRGRWNGR